MARPHGVRIDTSRGLRARFKGDLSDAAAHANALSSEYVAGQPDALSTLSHAPRRGRRTAALIENRQSRARTGVAERLLLPLAEAVAQTPVCRHSL